VSVVAAASEVFLVDGEAVEEELKVLAVNSEVLWVVDDGMLVVVVEASK